MYLDGTGVLSVSSGNFHADTSSLKQQNYLCKIIGLAFQDVPKNVGAGKGRTTSFRFPQHLFSA